MVEPWAARRIRKGIDDARLDKKANADSLFPFKAKPKSGPLTLRAQAYHRTADLFDPKRHTQRRDYLPPLPARGVSSSPESYEDADVPEGTYFEFP